MNNKNYPTHDLKFATVVFSVKICQHQLYGDRCEVFTDHRSLQHVFTQKDIKYSSCGKDHKNIMTFKLTNKIVFIT